MSLRWLHGEQAESWRVTRRQEQGFGGDDGLNQSRDDGMAERRQTS